MSEKLRGEAPERLTRRQKDVLQLVADGWSYVHIAQVFGLKSQTVKNLMREVRLRQGTANRAHAVAVALRNGDIL